MELGELLELSNLKKSKIIIKNDDINNDENNNNINNGNKIVNDEKIINLNKNTSSILFSNSKNSIIKFSNKEKGRYVVADRDIKAGESIVFREKPYAVCMNYKDERKICHHCFGHQDIGRHNKTLNTTPDFIINCESCKIVWYCSEYCKSKDYSIYHQHECSTYKKIQSSSQFDSHCKTSIKLLLKLIINQYNELIENEKQQQQQPSETTTTPEEVKPVTFKDILTLESNLNKFSTQRITEFRIITKFIEKSLSGTLILKKICGTTAKESIEFQNNLIKLMCILECNSHDISFTIPTTKSSYEYYSIGIALYYHSSLFNHTCEPNICKVIESKQHPILDINGNEIQEEQDNIDQQQQQREYCGNYATHSMISIRDIKKGEEISFNYIQLTLPKVERIKKLEVGYHFQCKCPSCIGDINNKNAIRSHNQFVEKYICKSRNGNCSGILFPLKDHSPSSNTTTTFTLTCNICRPIIFNSKQ